MKRIFLSIVIPAYNEENRIGGSLEKVVLFLKSQKFSYEVIVVDDGSKDRTREIAAEKLKGIPHRIIESDRNRGKGFAVRTGMLCAEGRFLVFTDADLSTPIEDVFTLIHGLESGYDVVIGSRALPLSRVEIHQNFLREAMGKIFNAFARLFAFHGISDSQCGFKGFTQEAAQSLFTKQRIEGFGFDAEILFLAQQKKMRILEAPVTWKNSPNSRVSIWQDPPKMLWDLLRIRFLHMIPRAHDSTQDSVCRPRKNS